jgi:hypothetical protein
MADYILLMHDDAQAGERDWDGYLARLRAGGCFQGGSAIGDGASFRKTGQAGAVSGHLSGFIRISADSLEAAQSALEGNPVYEAGGTVEIRELPVTG